MEKRKVFFMPLFLPDFGLWGSFACVMMVTQIAPNSNGKVIQKYFAKLCNVMSDCGNSPEGKVVKTS